MIVLYILLASFVNGYSLTCNDQPKDIVILLDSSDSISNQDFNYAKYAIVKAIHSLKVSKDHSRVAFIQFGSKAFINFNLDKYDSTKDVIISIKNAQHTHGLTAIGKALQLTMTDVLPKMRATVKKLVIIFTDGTNNVYPTPQTYADNIKSKKVRIICVGIGSEINKAELRRMASPKSVLLISTFQELVSEAKQISDKLCHKPDPIPFKPCTVPQQDLIFVIDSSDSLSTDDFIKSKEFVKSIIKNMKLGSDTTRVAMITFSGTVRLDFNVDTYTKEKDYIQAIDNAKKFGSITAIGSAFNEVLKSIWPKHRSGIPFNIILVTDGRNNKYPKPQVPATELKNKGARIVSVGVGKDINFEELREISSNNRMITVLSYSHLLKDIESVEKVVSCE